MTGSGSSAQRDAAASPGKRLVQGLAVGIAILVIPSMLAFQFLTHSHPIYRQAVTSVQQSARGRALLGENPRPFLWVYGRVRYGTALFEFDMKGSRREGTVRALAQRQEGGGWLMEYVLLTAQGTARPIRIHPETRPTPEGPSSH